MPAAIPIAVAAIGAAGSVAGGAISSRGAAAAAKKGRGGQHKFSLPPYQHALEQYYTRLLASNLTGVAPSFGEYVASGGTAKFPIQDTGFTPKEAADLKLVGPRGTPIPYVDPSQGQLTPEQQLFIGFQDKGSGTPLARAYQLNKRIGRIAADNPDADRLARLRARRDAFLAGPSGFGGLK